MFSATAFGETVIEYLVEDHVLELQPIQGLALEVELEAWRHVRVYLFVAYPARQNK